MDDSFLEVPVLRLQCGHLPVVVGAAPAADLYAVSFADILDEETEAGYQRPFDPQHSREFRKYIEQPNSTTIPLTFNLRGKQGHDWHLATAGTLPLMTLLIRKPTTDYPAILSRVDCQHRLGMMQDSAISLTFQCFLGLSQREEMAIFNTINSKAKGLNPSLLDFHTTKLAANLEQTCPELHIAETLRTDRDSVWFGLVQIGGAGTQGAHRRVTLRGLQAGTKQLLKRSPLAFRTDLSPRQKYEIVRAYWGAIAAAWPGAWSRPRTHLLMKGVGVMALSMLGGDILTTAFARQQSLTAAILGDYLEPLKDFDWSNTGAIKSYNGRQGAGEIHDLLRRRLFTPGLVAARRT